MSYFVGSKTVVMIDRDSWGCCYSAARGEILRFPEEQLMRKHSPRMSSLIKNESREIGRATSELQSHHDLVCRLLLEKKKKAKKKNKKTNKKTNNT